MTAAAKAVAFRDWAGPTPASAETLAGMHPHSQATDGFFTAGRTQLLRMTSSGNIGLINARAFMDHQIICMGKMTSADYRRNGRIGPCQRPQNTHRRAPMDEGTIHVDRTSPGVAEISPTLPGLRPSDLGVGKIRIERERIVYRGSRRPCENVCAVAINVQGRSRRAGAQIPPGSRTCCRSALAHRGDKITNRRNAPGLSVPPINRMGAAPTERRMVCGREPPKRYADSGDMNPPGVRRRRSAPGNGRTEPFRTQFRDFQEMRPPARDIREDSELTCPARSAGTDKPDRAARTKVPG